MNEEEIEGVFMSSNDFLESLIRSRANLKDSPSLSEALDEVIALELALALRGAEKAMSNLIKASSGVASITPLKGA